MNEKLGPRHHGMVGLFGSLEAMAVPGALGVVSRSGMGEKKVGRYDSSECQRVRNASSENADRCDTKAFIFC